MFDEFFKVQIIAVKPSRCGFSRGISIAISSSPGVVQVDRAIGRLVELFGHDGHGRIFPAKSIVVLATGNESDNTCVLNYCICDTRIRVFLTFFEAVTFRQSIIIDRCCFFPQAVVVCRLQRPGHRSSPPQ
jgi:hypothetical protein